MQKMKAGLSCRGMRGPHNLGSRLESTTFFNASTGDCCNVCKPPVKTNTNYVICYTLHGKPHAPHARMASCGLSGLQDFRTLGLHGL